MFYVSAWLLKSLKVFFRPFIPFSLKPTKTSFTSNFFSSSAPQKPVSVTDLTAASLYNATCVYTEYLGT